MVHITFSVFTDVMLWGTIPLMGLLGLWEYHLAMSEADHKLVQMMLVIIVFTWAYFWNSMGVRDRLAHPKSQYVNHRIKYYFGSGITKPVETNNIPDYTCSQLEPKKGVSNEIVEQYHVSNN
ncbi:MAG: hypothetical protein ACYDHA_04060 [Bellilinea sp.]